LQVRRRRKQAPRDTCPASPGNHAAGHALALATGRGERFPASRGRSWPTKCQRTVPSRLQPGSEITLVDCLACSRMPGQRRRVGIYSGGRNDRASACWPAGDSAWRIVAFSQKNHLFALWRLVPASGSFRNAGESDRSMSSENRPAQRPTELLDCLGLVLRGAFA
jgi:hypothetical protein